MHHRRTATTILDDFLSKFPKKIKGSQKHKTSMLEAATKIDEMSKTHLQLRNVKFLKHNLSLLEKLFRYLEDRIKEYELFAPKDPMIYVTKANIFIGLDEKEELFANKKDFVLHFSNDTKTLKGKEEKLRIYNKQGEHLLVERNQIEKTNDKVNKHFDLSQLEVRATKKIEAPPDLHKFLETQEKNIFGKGTPYVAVRKNDTTHQGTLVYDKQDEIIVTDRTDEQYWEAINASKNNIRGKINKRHIMQVITFEPYELLNSKDFKGIHNVGNTCWSNSATQALRAFSNWGVKGRGIWKRLHKFYNFDFNRYTRKSETKDLLIETLQSCPLALDDVKKGNQADPSAWLNEICQQIVNDNETDLKHISNFVLKSKLITRRNQASVFLEFVTNSLVELRGVENINELLISELKTTVGKMPSRAITEGRRFPPVLIIILDPWGLHQWKQNIGGLNIDDELKIDVTINEFSNNDNLRRQWHYEDRQLHSYQYIKYELAGACVHRGSISSGTRGGGHWWFVYKTKDKEWIKVNDETITIHGARGKGINDLLKIDGNIQGYSVYGQRPKILFYRMIVPSI